MQLLKIKSNYTGLTERMLAFQKEGFMPISVNFGALTEGYDTLELSLFNNKASYHNNCRSMFNSRQMVRMKAKSVAVDTEPTQDRTAVQTRVEGSHLKATLVRFSHVLQVLIMMTRDTFWQKQHA